MVRVRFAPSPTGSLHLGGALTAVANRSFADRHGGVMVVRIDDTDASRSREDAEAAILADLEWLGIEWDEGPVRQSERGDIYRAAAGRLVALGAAYEDEGAIRFREERKPTLLRADGSATYHLASVVDDIELVISHVIRGRDHLPNTPLQQGLTRALGWTPPEYIHHGLLLGPDGAKLSKRHGASSVTDLREQGIPAEAVLRYLEELGSPRGDVHFDPARLRRLALESIAALSDEELAARIGAPTAVVPAVRGARDLVEAARTASLILAPPRSWHAPPAAVETLERFRELRAGANGDLDGEAAKWIVRELKAAGGDLRALRLALTGAERGPELWTVVLALPREEALARAERASARATP